MTETTQQPKATIRRAELHALFHALSALDGRQVIVKDGDGGEAIAVIPYAFDGKTRMKIARARRLARADVEDYNEANNLLIRELDPSGTVKRTSPQWGTYTERRDQLMRAPVEIELPRIALDELKLETNAIPPSVLDGLAPVLDG